MGADESSVAGAAGSHGACVSAEGARKGTQEAGVNIPGVHIVPLRARQMLLLALLVHTSRLSVWAAHFKRMEGTCPSALDTDAAALPSLHSRHARKPRMSLLSQSVKGCIAYCLSARDSKSPRTVI